MLNSRTRSGNESLLLAMSFLPRASAIRSLSNPVLSKIMVRVLLIPAIFSSIPLFSLITSFCSKIIFTSCFPTFPYPAINRFTFTLGTPKNSSWTARMASSTSAVATTAETFFSDEPCAMARIVMFLLPMASNMRPLAPDWFFISSPIRLIMENPHSTFSGSTLFSDIS